MRNLNVWCVEKRKPHQTCTLVILAIDGRGFDRLYASPSKSKQAISKLGSGVSGTYFHEVEQFEKQVPDTPDLDGRDKVKELCSCAKSVGGGCECANDVADDKRYPSHRRVAAADQQVAQSGLAQLKMRMDR
jgi:hypothetical protein